MNVSAGSTVVTARPKGEGGGKSKNLVDFVVSRFFKENIWFILYVYMKCLVHFRFIPLVCLYIQV